MTTRRQRGRAMSLAAILAAATLLTISSPASAEETAGAIFFTDEVVSSELTPGCTSYIPTYAATSTAPTGDAGKLVPSFAIGGLACGSHVEYVAESDFVLTEGLAEVHLFYACEVRGALQDLWVDFYHEGSAVSVQNSLDRGLDGLSDPIMCEGPGDVTQLVVPIQTKDTAVAAGDSLSWTITLFENAPNPPYNPDAHEANVHIKVDGAAFPSGFYHPVLLRVPPDTGPVVVHQNLTDDDASINHEFVTPQNSTFLFNWTNSYDGVQVAGASNATNGTAKITVSDGQAELINQTLQGNGTIDEALEGIAPGNWTIHVDYTAYVGTFSLRITELQDSGTGTQTQTQTSTTGPSGTQTGTTTGTTESNQTGNGTAGGQESPALPLAFLAGAIVVSVAIRRRR